MDRFDCRMGYGLRREQEPGFFPFGLAQGYGWWKRSHREALWNDTKRKVGMMTQQL